MNRKKALVTKTPKDYKLLWMAMPFIVIVFLFSYVPIFGWIYSFFDYVPGVSIFNCDFVGLDYFKLIFRDDNILRSLKNTFIFAIINICLTPLPMFMAILLNELRNGPIKKFTQTFTTLPNFISWVIIFSLATALFASDGIVTGLATAMGLGDASNSLLGSNEAVYWFQSFLLQWKTLGWNSIIYMAAISGIDQEQYEAARVDGAGYFQCALHVTLPAMMETFVVLFILNIGNFLNTGYEQIFLMANDLNASKAEVFDTYVYKRGIIMGQYSYSTAVGLFKSVVGMIMVLSSNWIAKKCGESGLY